MGIALALMASVVLSLSCLAADSEVSSRGMAGLPLLRSYSLNEIGVSRAARISFDRYGRVGVVSGHSFFILNDNSWVDLFEQSEGIPQLLEVVWDARAGCYYYGSLASWGRIWEQPDGSFRLEDRRTEDSPQWVMSTNFSQIFCSEQGVLFAGYNGVVLEDFETGETAYFALPDVVRAFPHGSEIYVSSQSKGLFRLDYARRKLEWVDATVVDEEADLGQGQTLLTTTGGNFYKFVGDRIEPWGHRYTSIKNGVISHLISLSDGGLAMAIDGGGVYVFSRDGEVLVSMTTMDYHRVLDVASNEKGILWITTEASVQKIFYDGGISLVDQRSGVMVGWPQVVSWAGGTCVASWGRLYDIIPSEDGVSMKCRQVDSIPISGTWGIAADEIGMLVGNGSGVFERHGDEFEQVLEGIDGVRLVLDGKGLCYVLSSNEIAVMRRTDDGGWEECAERLPGVGFPAIVHYYGHSVWVELGLDLAARIWYGDGVLHAELYEDYIWSQPSWVNIGNIGSKVIFSGGGKRRMFFDEERGVFVEAPELQEVLLEAPFNVKRMEVDSRGSLWAVHEHGLLRLAAGENQEWESPIVGSFRDQYPILHMPNEDEVWMSTESSLYQINPDRLEWKANPLHPSLISMSDARTKERIYTAGLGAEMPQRIPYEQNNLMLQFFAGGYSYVHGLSYLFTIEGDAVDYTMNSNDSVLPLVNLWEGSYQVSVQLLEGETPIFEPSRLSLTILPPWYRTRGAYLGYGLVLLLGGLVVRWLVLRQAKSRHLYLEHLVKERTEDLRSTMLKLTEEARVSATLAERNRLAGEIHDSVQQGLSGLMLQIDATLKLRNVKDEVKTRLEMARKMVSYTREEVQQAIRDLESPFLANADLPGALESMAELVTLGEPGVELYIRGEVVELAPSVQHHLLRIAQEAITNAVRHSHSKNIVVEVEYGEQKLELRVKDFGIGFSGKEIVANEPGHFGLRGIRTRVSKLNGNFDIDSEPGQGTTVSVCIPIEDDLKTEEKD